MFNHKIYMPNISHALRDELKKGLTEEWGGCTMYHANGYWQDNDKNVCSEPVLVFEVLTSSSSRPSAFDDAIKGLLALDEECVLVTMSEEKAEFIYGNSD